MALFMIYLTITCMVQGDVKGAAAQKLSVQKLSVQKLSVSKLGMSKLGMSKLGGVALKFGAATAARAAFTAASPILKLLVIPSAVIGVVSYNAMWRTANSFTCYVCGMSQNHRDEMSYRNEVISGLAGGVVATAVASAAMAIPSTGWMGLVGRGLLASCISGGCTQGAVQHWWHKTFSEQQQQN